MEELTMTAKLYYFSTNRSFTQVKNHLLDNGIDYKAQHLKSEPLKWEQLQEILTHTENGISDLLSLKSLDYKGLVAQGVDFDDLTLKQFHELVVKYPKLIKSPILVAKNTTLIGYNADEMSVLEKRKDRMKRYREVLSTLQLNDINVPDEAFAYSV